jgi:outer membrane protein TolC
MAQLRGALGLTRGQPDPPMPARFETTALDLEGGALLDAAFARNPRLKAMESEVRLAESLIGLARTSKMPDFSAGVQAEVYSPPFYWPQGSMSLPIWRDKIAAQIAEAQAGKRAAEARLTSEQIMVTVDFAMKSYDYREITRNLALLRDQLIPKAGKSLEMARAGYMSGCGTDVAELPIGGSGGAHPPRNYSGRLVAVHRWDNAGRCTHSAASVERDFSNSHVEEFQTLILL